MSSPTSPSPNSRIGPAPDGASCPSARRARLPPAPSGVVAHAPGGFDPTRPLAGLFVDAWAEVIPSAEHTAGVAFHYDAPGARPPQAIVLAVHPDLEPERWNLQYLLETVQETISLARLRTVTLRELDGMAGLIPALYLPNNYTRDVRVGVVQGPGHGGPGGQAGRRPHRDPRQAMTDPIWSLPIAKLDVELAKLPSAVTWSRLEPLTLTSDLTAGLQALLGDPLWLLGRQWQFGELRGEDAGTPISAIVEIEQAPLSRLRRGSSGPPIDLVDESVPLEARIEAEPVPVPAERVRAEAGLQLLRRLAVAGLGTLRTRVIAAVGVRRGRIAGAGRSRPRRRAGRRRPAPAGRSGRRPAHRAAGRVRQRSGGGAHACSPTGCAGTTATSCAATAPPGTRTARSTRSRCRPSCRAARCSSPRRSTRPAGSTGPTSTPRSARSARPRPGASARSTRQVRLPVPARFPGMPADRLWQFEDARVYLGGLEAGPTDLARLALVEFSLAYGVDWFVLPVELVAGSVYWVHQLEVVDTFGTTGERRFGARGRLVDVRPRPPR